MSAWDVIHGDCLDVMREMPDASVDAIVTDPPYELSFMNRKWDGTGIASRVETWAEVFRVLRPGGHLLAFGGTRTSHRMACAIEDAGFEIRDTLAWLYGSGFPKSLDVSRALDKAVGAEREVIRERTYELRNDGGYSGGLNTTKPRSQTCEITAPATDAARQWDGWGTALKPAHEPITLARKPLSEPTVAANVLKHGTGAVNVDGCRIGDVSTVRSNRADMGYHGGLAAAGTGYSTGSASGRWPANVLLDQDAAEELGDPARYFYVAKASRAERNAGLEGMPERAYGLHDDDNYRKPGERKANHTAPMPAANTHPTVKPIALMRWLCRLVTPPGGVILDPFTGSGSTGCAAIAEGFGFLGIEQDAEYVRYAVNRIAYHATQAKQLTMAAD